LGALVKKEKNVFNDRLTAGRVEFFGGGFSGLVSLPAQTAEAFFCTGVISARFVTGGV
jgi:hypothetical protein